MAPRRSCWPNCKPIDKRDFMDINPEKTSADFYARYDPMIGVLTVGMLVLFIAMISMKSIVKCTVRKLKYWKYDRKLNALRSAQQSARPSKDTIKFMHDETQCIDSTNQNGMI
ncbi:hypothetical protein M3Y97_00873000 [Aphelenchoides bicaudatus]|nr:hypothetical protein M3Y97_00873000 [Aphelenchoides bicaudatus]